MYCVIYDVQFCTNNEKKKRRTKWIFPGQSIDNLLFQPPQKKNRLFCSAILSPSGHQALEQDFIMVGGFEKNVYNI